MKATFNMKFEMDLPYILNKEEMMERIRLFGNHLGDHLEDWITHIELLNHTLVING